MPFRIASDACEGRFPFGDTGPFSAAYSTTARALPEPDLIFQVAASALFNRRLLPSGWVMRKGHHRDVLQTSLLTRCFAAVIALFFPLCFDQKSSVFNNSRFEIGSEQ